MSGRQGAGRGSLGGEGEKEHTLLMDQLKSTESKLKGLLVKEKEKQENRYEDLEDNRYYRTEPRVAIVDWCNKEIGYTNVGKSQLMNKLLDRREVSSQNRLFETLKTTSRSISLDNNMRGVLIDTIGFISNLPSELVDSFSSTFREISSCDVVVMMEDISHPLYLAHREIALNIIYKIGMDDLLNDDKLVWVWNKTDCVSQERIDRCLEAEPNRERVILASVKNGKGVEEIRERIREKADGLFKREARMLSYEAEEHEERIGWLRENGGISHMDKLDVFERGDGSKVMKARVKMSENLFERYNEHFYNKKRDGDGNVEKKKMRKRDIVPDGWLDK